MFTPLTAVKQLSCRWVVETKCSSYDRVFKFSHQLVAIAIKTHFWTKLVNFADECHHIASIQQISSHVIAIFISYSIQSLGNVFLFFFLSKSHNCFVCIWFIEFQIWVAWFCRWFRFLLFFSFIRFNLFQNRVYFCLEFIKYLRGFIFRSIWFVIESIHQLNSHLSFKISHSWKSKLFPSTKIYSLNS